MSSWGWVEQGQASSSEAEGLLQLRGDPFHAPLPVTPKLPLLRAPVGREGWAPPAASALLLDSPTFRGGKQGAR